MARIPRFVFTPRWIALLLFVLLVAGVCIRLGIWQLDRLDQRRTFNAQVTSGLAAEPVPLDAVLPPGRDPDGLDALAYRRVEVTGTYDPAHEVLLFGRALDGEPGHHVLTPLVTADGRAVIVDRGWVPYELDTPPVEPAAPPAGEITVDGFLLLPGEPTDEVRRGADGRLLTVTSVDVALVGEELPSVAPMAVQLQTQDPAQPGDLPRLVGPPELSEGPHLSYAVQWFCFAAIALVGYVVLVRREVRDREREPASSVPG
jgi:surfeit locus 1 family protein